MSITWDKVRILQESETAFQRFTSFCRQVSNDLFFIQPEGKWSVAQNVHHLVTATKTATAAYALPGILVRLIGGNPDRPSRSYDELLAKYNEKLASGAKARGRYIPASIKPSAGKERIIADWHKATVIYLQAIKKNRTDKQLDQYIVPHPLLGKITLRELCYFNIFHTLHHLELLKARK